MKLFEVDHFNDFREYVLAPGLEQVKPFLIDHGKVTEPDELHDVEICEIEMPEEMESWAAEQTEPVYMGSDDGGFPVTLRCQSCGNEWNVKADGVWLLDSYETIIRDGEPMNCEKCGGEGDWKDL